MALICCLLVRILTSKLFFHEALKYQAHPLKLPSSQFYLNFPPCCSLHPLENPQGNYLDWVQQHNLMKSNYAVGPNQDSFLEDFLEDVKSNMEENSDKIGMREALMDALDTLTPREKKVLMLRYGLEDS